MKFIQLDKLNIEYKVTKSKRQTMAFINIEHNTHPTELFGLDGYFL